jgi:hypothetical protein
MDEISHCTNSTLLARRVVLPSANKAYLDENSNHREVNHTKYKYRFLPVWKSACEASERI